VGMKRIIVLVILFLFIFFTAFTKGEEKGEEEIAKSMGNVCGVKKFRVIVTDRFYALNAFTHFTHYTNVEYIYEIELPAYIRNRAFPKDILYFIIAHELGHVYHDHGRKLYEMKDKKEKKNKIIRFRKKAEREADYFAGGCLVRFLGSCERALKSAEEFFKYACTGDCIDIHNIHEKKGLRLNIIEEGCSDPP
jgi:hypothetical protein